MKYLVLCFTFNFLFFTNTVYSALTVDAPLEVKWDKNGFKLQCNASGADGSIHASWHKDNTPVTASSRIKQLSESNLFTLQFTSAVENDVGNYTCVLTHGSEKQEKTITVTGQVLVKVPSNINVVEGEKLRIHCQIAGTPTAKLSWTFNPDGQNNETDLTESGRYSFEKDERDIPNSILIVTDIKMSDRGHYTCIGESGSSKHESKSMVRIKDKYAALWPFLGIVAEVVILCAIIFIYEKKHNKAELDESDTDQSPDQKNTPDHGKDSNLRHRQ